MTRASQRACMPRATTHTCAINQWRVDSTPGRNPVATNPHGRPHPQICRDCSVSDALSDWMRTLWRRPPRPRRRPSAQRPRAAAAALIASEGCSCSHNQHTRKRAKCQTRRENTTHTASRTPVDAQRMVLSNRPRGNAIGERACADRAPQGSHTNGQTRIASLLHAPRRCSWAVRVYHACVNTIATQCARHCRSADRIVAVDRARAIEERKSDAVRGAAFERTSDR